MKKHSTLRTGLASRSITKNPMESSSEYSFCLFITFLRMEREAKRVRRVECVFMIQKCYEEAETVFRRALHGRDRVLVHNHEETLYSTYSLLSSQKSLSKHWCCHFILFLVIEREAKPVRRVESSRSILRNVMKRQKLYSDELSMGEIGC
jgi:hypothetical protein